MTGTIFCDSTGMRMLVVARNRAEFCGAALRIVIRPGGAVARSRAIAGLDRALPLYHSLQEATQARSGTSRPVP